MLVNMRRRRAAMSVPGDCRAPMRLYADAIVRLLLLLSDDVDGDDVDGATDGDGVR